VGGPGAHFRWDGPDLVLNLRGKPGARRDAFVRVQGDRLVVQIAAVAEDGKATAHLLGALAKAFDVPRAAVTLVYGETSPNKQVRIARPRRLPPEAGVPAWPG